MRLVEAIIEFKVIYERFLGALNTKKTLHNSPESLNITIVVVKR